MINCPNCGHALQATRQTVISLKDFMLKLNVGILLDNGVPVELTEREFMLAEILFSSPNIFLTRKMISKAVWKRDISTTSRTIEQHMYKLRKKLKLCIERGVWIRTSYSKGYCLVILKD